MIQTDKYQKGIRALASKVAELDPQIGGYVAHFINTRGMFLVKFSNGHFEIDISLARRFEQWPEYQGTGKLRRMLFPGMDNDKEPDEDNAVVNASWRKLFSPTTKH